MGDEIRRSGGSDRAGGARLAGHGVEHDPVQTYGNGVRHVVVLDPDGNGLPLAESPTG